MALAFDLQSGNEQQGQRPTLFVSNDQFNKATGFCIACTVTNTRRDDPFHVSIPEGVEVTGVVMVEQVKSIDWNSRAAKRIGTAPESLLREVPLNPGRIYLLKACAEQLLEKTGRITNWLLGRPDVPALVDSRQATAVRA